MIRDVLWHLYLSHNWPHERQNTAEACSLKAAARLKVDVFQVRKKDREDLDKSKAISKIWKKGDITMEPI